MDFSITYLGLSGTQKVKFSDFQKQADPDLGPLSKIQWMTIVTHTTFFILHDITSVHCYEFSSKRSFLRPPKTELRFFFLSYTSKTHYFPVNIYSMSSYTWVHILFMSAFNLNCKLRGQRMYFQFFFYFCKHLAMPTHLPGF